MTRKGVWNLQQVRDKYLQELWVNESQLFYWGENGRGEFGQNNRTNYSSPVQVPGTTWGNTPSNTTFYTSGGTANIKTDGTLWMWGENSKGQLGQNSVVNYSSPVQIGSGTDWSEVLTGNKCTYATKTDGTAWAWGDDNSGKLGLNQAEVSRSSPVQIPGTNWSTISPMRYSAMGIKTDGTLWGWGYQGYGGLGVNDTIRYSSPVQVPGTTWSAVVGDEYTIARKTNGTLWAWGPNGAGHLGLNSLTTYSSPVQVPGTTWSDQIGATGSVGGALKTDGTLWTWGYNGDGRLGHNQGTGGMPGAYSSPVQVGTDTTWSLLSIANSRMAAIKTDATLWMWGNNTNGRLGQNNLTEYSSPTQIPGAWTSVRATTNYTFGLKNLLTPSQL